MTKQLIESVIQRIDWESFKTGVETKFDKAQFTSVDLQTTNAYINSIIESSLSIYVDKQFMHQFEVWISPLKFGQRLEVTLSFDGRVLVDWSIDLEPYLF